MNEHPYYSEKTSGTLLPMFLQNYTNRRTSTEYSNYIGALCMYLKKDFLDITSEDAGKYYGYLCSKHVNGQISQQTINTRFSCYRTFGRFICENALHDGYSNPFTKICPDTVNDNVSISNIPTMQELDRIMNSCDSDMYYLILALAGRAAMRASEILHIRCEDILIEGNTVIIETHRKNADSNSLVLPEDVSALMVNYLENYVAYDEDHYLFYNKYHNPLTARNLDSAIKRIVERSGVSHHYTLKDIRSRAIVDMKNANIDEDTISNYVGITKMRVGMYSNAAHVVRPCPADLVNYRLTNE